MFAAVKLPLNNTAEVPQFALNQKKNEKKQQQNAPVLHRSAALVI